ncbi:uncharacterized protein LOC9661278 [Selaginella moellendorffii]|uniref:uncharacterized protein LOC9661278 n=1 Tax=Selaginella moellendorffii TaxID=88036 RepID=UPI000D1C8F9F|nr:uncharacterized protein LOC9661278 [Selaginella moellendorffii]|eukprot:XP_002982670.2 uncharacterized protein LOC9661278 [Selaginella moellendorffii]
MEASVAKTSVWWDIENCRPPADVNPFHIARNISNVLHAFNFFGPLTISAYGDTYQLTRHVQNALTSTGISLNHIPSGRKEASDKAILMNMAFWTSDNPPPANVVLISGDQDFSPLLHRLQMKRFNVLLVRPEGVHVSESLLNSARTVWYWTRLARAEVSYLSVPRDVKAFGLPPGARPLAPNGGGRMENAVGPIARPPFMVPGYRSPGHQMMAEMRQPPPLQQQYAPRDDINRPLFLQWPSSPQCFSGRSSEGFGAARSQWFGGPDFGGEQDFYYGRELIRRVLDTLKVEMMLPTEANIYNCVVYGEKQALGFNLRRALEEGVKLGELAIKNAGVGGAEEIFLPAGYDLWPYVDPNLCQEYDADIWSDFRSYLCSERVHVFINAANQYDAALILRAHRVGRLTDLSLAQIYNVIQLAILVRLWIKPHPRTWSPLGITISRNPMAGPACTAVLEEKAVDVVHQSAVSEELVNYERTAIDVVNKVLEETTLDVLAKPVPVTLEGPPPPARAQRHPPEPPSRPTQIEREKCVEEPAIHVTKQAEVKLQVVAPVASVAKQHYESPAKIAKEPPVSVVKELKSWLPSVLTVDGYDISLVRQEFKTARGLTLDHQALGHAKLLDLMKKFPDVVQISYPRPGLCKLYPPGTTVVTQVKTKEKEKDKDKAPGTSDIMHRLRGWLPLFIGRRGVCDLASVCKEFEAECKLKLEASELGFSSTSTLLEQFSDIVRLEHLQSGDIVLTSATKKASSTASRERESLAQAPVEAAAAARQQPSPKGAAVDFPAKMRADCKALLLESIPSCKSGYPLARLKGDFQQHYGYALDHAGCGFKKLETFLELLKDSIGIWTGSGGHKLLHLKEPEDSNVEEKIKGEDNVKNRERVDELDEVATTLEPEEEENEKEKAMVDAKKRKKASEASVLETGKAQAPASNAKPQGVSKSSSSGKLKMGGGKLSAQLPACLRHSFAEKVAETSLAFKPSNPLSMVD